MPFQDSRQKMPLMSTARFPNISEYDCVGEFGVHSM